MGCLCAGTVNTSVTTELFFCNEKRNFIGLYLISSPLKIIACCCCLCFEFELRHLASITIKLFSSSLRRSGGLKLLKLCVRNKVV